MASDKSGSHKSASEKSFVDYSDMRRGTVGYNRRISKAR